MAKTGLELSTFTEHSTVNIDGKPYDLANSDELSLVDCHRVAAGGALAASLSSAPTEENAAELETLLSNLCRIILRAPKDIHDKLNDQQRMSICQVFTALRRQEQSPVVAPPETSTGANTLPV
jgi:hypothetical protein